MREKRQCAAHTRSGKPCKGQVIKGATVCRMHGGASPQVKAKAKERLELEKATQAVENYGLPREIDPHSALLEELWRTAGHVAGLNFKVRDLEERELHGPVGGGRDAYPREEPHVWIRLYQEERGHFAKVAKSCIEVGIAERQVKLAEQQGMMIAKVIQAVLEDLGVADNPKVPAVVRRHLSLAA